MDVRVGVDVMSSDGRGRSGHLPSYRNNKAMDRPFDFNAFAVAVAVTVVAFGWNTTSFPDP